MPRAATVAHLGAACVLLSLFLPVVGGPLLAAMQGQVGSLPAGFSVFDLARLHGLEAISWHVLIVLTLGCLAALMAFTGPHQGLWVPAGLWLLGITVELRIITRELAVINADAPADSIFRASIEPWGWTAAGAGALLMVASGLTAARRASAT